MKHTRILVVAAALGLALLMSGCGMSGLGALATTTSASQSVTLPATPTAGPVQLSRPLPMGQTATSTAFTITVKDAVRRPQAGGVAATKGRELVVILFWWHNLSTTTQMVGSSAFTLADKGGTVYPPAPTSGPGFISTLQAMVKPGTTCPVLIAYQVPTGVGPFTWTYSLVPPGSTSAVPQAMLEVK